MIRIFKGRTREEQLKVNALQMRKWREKNPELSKEIDKRYREKNKEKIRIRKAKYYRECGDVIRFKARLAYHQNPKQPYVKLAQ